MTWRALCVVLLLAGCEGADDATARGAAEAFLDRHYVEIDLPGSRDYTVGLARRKVDERIRLTSGHSIDAGTRKPRVYYSLLERREAGEGAAFVYDLAVRPEGADEFHRRILVRVRREGPGWRVSNYVEYGGG